jgi:hypothetical protein
VIGCFENFSLLRRVEIGNLRVDCRFGSVRLPSLTLISSITVWFLLYVQVILSLVIFFFFFCSHISAFDELLLNPEVMKKKNNDHLGMFYKYLCSLSIKEW